MKQKLSVFTILLFQSLMLLYSCTNLSVEKERRISIKNRIAEEYFNSAMEALDRLEISRALVLLIRAHYRAPEESVIIDALEDLTDSLESKAFYTKQIIKKGRGLEHPLQYQLVYRSKEETVPVRDIPVHYSFFKGSGILTEGAITDDNGLAKCYVEEVKSFKKSISIKAQVILNIDRKQFTIDDLAQDYSFSSISIMDTPHSIILFFESHSLSEDEKNIPSLCKRMLDIFRDNGFSDIGCVQTIEPFLFQHAFGMDKSSLRIIADTTGSDVITLFWIKTSYLSQPSIDFFFSRAEVSTKIINTQDYSILFQETIGEEGAGSNQSESEQQALTKTMIRVTERIALYLKRIRRENGV